MQGHMLIIRPHPTDDQQHVEHKEIDYDPPLEELQGIVGGHIEKVPIWDEIEWRDERTNEVNWVRCVVYSDGEGKLKGYEPNIVATLMWQEYQSKVHLPVQDHLVGTIVAIWGDAALWRSMTL